MDNTEQDIIPIDGRVEDFRKHLEANPRTVLSARFGDGKSFFLNQVIEKSKDDTTYIVVHPVHYQVSDNKDIFELVKRDILLQMIGLGMISANYEIPEHIIFSYYLQHSTTDIAKDLLSSLFKVLPNIATTTPIANSLEGFGGLGFSAIIEGIKSLGNSYASFKEDLSLDTNKLLETFFKGTDQLKNNPIESDAITALIRENIQRWQNEEGKRVVLVFEDMDRLDPAHLFRIMNVLSAQIDANCTIDEDPSGVTKNRFGVDNVVLVLDYNNLKSIFHHFYGLHTDFNGYIHKFAPKGYFKYSLRKERQSYLMGKLSYYTGLHSSILDLLTPSSGLSLHLILESISLREAVHCMDGLEYEIKPEARFGDITLSKGLLKTVIFLRRLGISEKEVVDLIEPIVKSWYMVQSSPKLFHLSLRHICGVEGQVILKTNDGDQLINFSLLKNRTLQIKQLDSTYNIEQSPKINLGILNNCHNRINTNKAITVTNRAHQYPSKLTLRQTTPRGIITPLFEYIYSIGDR